MNYFKKSSGEIFAFDDDQLDLITSDMTAMTDAEVDQHINPQNYYSDAEKSAAYIASLSALTKRQFNLYLYDNNKLDEVNTLLGENPRAKIEFDSTDKIERTSSTVTAMITALGWTDDEVNTMWQEALTL